MISDASWTGGGSWVLSAAACGDHESHAYPCSGFAICAKPRTRANGASRHLNSASVVCHTGVPRYNRRGTSMRTMVSAVVVRAIGRSGGARR